jgi:glucose-1-phosphate thymidylyltransferase
MTLVAGGAGLIFRGELEITSDNQVCLERGDLQIQLLGSRFTWLDTGTHEGLLNAAHFIEPIETRQGSKVACREENCDGQRLAISRTNMRDGESLRKNAYGQYLLSLVENKQ